MKNKAIILSSVLVSSILFMGCNGDNNDKAIEAKNAAEAEANSINLVVSNTMRTLTAQTAVTTSHLFYGSSNHTGLGSLANISTYDTDTNVSTSQDADIESRYPAMSTSLTYNKTSNTYSDMHISEVSYEANSTLYGVDMSTGTKRTFDDVNVSVDHTTINYLGANQYAIVEEADGSLSLVAPDAAINGSVPFTNKSLLGVTYQAYGDAIDGYLVINDDDHDYETENQFQKCNLAMDTCTDIASFADKTIISHGSAKTVYDMEILGDVPGTTKSYYISNNEIVELDKANGDITVMTSVATGSTEHTLQGDEVYYVNMMNIYKTTLDGTVTQLSSNGLAMGFEAFTTDMVIFGGDTYMYAVAKDGSLKVSPIEISVVTKLTGQKYPFDLGIGDQYLFTLYSVDAKTGKNTFYACKLEDKKKECRENSYWSGVTAKRAGTISNTSSYEYTPYAYIRVDTNTDDNYGGGAIKAIDPEYPLDDGLTMGNLDIFNFQTFVNSKYDNDMVDNNGNIVLYAKNDIDFRGNAYLVNLNQENSLVNLTNEAAPDVSIMNEGGSHCHGRMCSVCHSFSGGKIYATGISAWTGEESIISADGYTIRFDFRDASTSVLALVRKGTGENFNTPLEGLVGKSFKASVISTDGNDTIVNNTSSYSHDGVEFFNCNYCHGRNGQLLHGAPDLIMAE